MGITLKNSIIRLSSAVLGIKTTRKIVVINSDDWGSMRVESSGARSALIKSGIPMDTNRFDRFDTLESDSDIEMLYEILMKHEDHNGNHPVITAVTNVSNPDFYKIKQSNFQDYYYNNLLETHAQYYGHEKVYNFYLEGIRLGIFLPQSHGREHLHVKRWMSTLRSGNELARTAFDQKYYMLDLNFDSQKSGGGFGAAFDLDSLDELVGQEDVIKDGLCIFERLFNYKSIYFQAPSESFNDHINKTLLEQGVKLIDVPKIRKIPIGSNKFKYKLHYLGQKNTLGQTYITRNAVFEPNISDSSNGVDRCISDIEFAFKCQKPAIISNHRASFVGGIDPRNRDKGLKSLDQLFGMIIKKWPDVEFMSMPKLYTTFFNE